MKYAIIIPDGCADEPQESLGGKTPLAVARTPHMDSLAAAGMVGRASNVPKTLPAGSDVAMMSLLGYDPMVHYTGRAPLETAAQGIALGPADWAVRCNLVTIEDQVMRSFTADQITSEEARDLLAVAQEELGGDGLEFVPGVSYRNLLLWRDGTKPPPFTEETRTTPPHDLTDKLVTEDYPRGPGSWILNQIMNDSFAVFRDHPVNRARRNAGKLPATNLWLWGQGRAPSFQSFADAYGVRRGAMITAVDLLRGLASLIGWDRIDVPGATGYTDTDYAAKGRYAIDAIQGAYDIICVHIEATDEASHEGDCAAKIAALEAIDQDIVGPLAEVLRCRDNWRLLVSPDHPTPIRTKTHSHGSVPFVMAGSDVQPDTNTVYDDATADMSGCSFPVGWKLMRFFLGGT
ncbi:MAG: cofactor-independent phosphoglycerate mutase [Pirellulales bacterium]|nr:cofactor-independent phosphoglycerate mutase [Pirellulales bacterium]